MSDTKYALAQAQADYETAKGIGSIDYWDDTRPGFLRELAEARAFIAAIRERQAMAREAK